MNDNDASAVIRVLIVEDESIPAYYLKGIIEKENAFRVEKIVPDASSALEAVETIHPEIVFMDIMIEGATSGAELALKIHSLYPDILIIFMTAYSTDEMMEYAVDAEAFAYLLKPYRPREIRATLALAGARLRKAVPEPASRSLELVGGYRCHELGRLTYAGKDVPLSPKEAGLIEILCEHIGHVVPTSVIKERLDLTDSSLRALIYRLRKNTSEKLIQSVKRYGYRIASIKGYY